MEYLYFLNFFVWFIPVLFYKGMNRFFVFIVSYLFSQSYWLYPMLMDLFELSHFSVVVLSKIELVVLYSIFSGVAFNLSMLISSGKYTFVKPEFSFSYTILLKNFFNFIFFFRLLVFLLIFYCFYMSFGEIDSSYRGEFLSRKLFWYTVVLPLVIAILFFIQVYDYNRLKENFDFFHLVTFTQILLVLVLLGFDGSRREAVFLLMPLSVFIIKYYFESQRSKITARLAFLTIIFVFISSFLSLNRAGLVGWNFIFEADFFTLLKGSVYVFSPMSTLHVNTQMLEYTELNGFQGFSNYFQAIGNFLFPSFLFREYIFGEPLVIKIHNELGWNGMDFGFMAEAIYSGGLFAVILLHSFYGVFVGSVLKLSSKNKSYAVVFLFFIVYGMVNALRSDFMNLLKTTFYFPFFILAILFLIRKIKF